MLKNPANPNSESYLLSENRIMEKMMFITIKYGNTLLKNTKNELLE